MFELIPYERFRDTPAVRFFDVTIGSSNARDLVIHSGPAISPPNDLKTEDWWLLTYQILYKYCHTPTLSE